MNTATKTDPLDDKDAPTVRKGEMMLFGRHPEVVEIRKGATNPEAQRRALWEHCLTVARATDNPVATLRTLVGKQPVATRLAGRHDYFATPATPPRDKGAMTVGALAMREIDELAAKERRGDPTLTREGAVAKALQTPAGQRAYAQYRRPDHHSTVLEMAAVVKRAIVNVDHLRQWNATTCAQFIDDRLRDVDPNAKRNADALVAAYSVVKRAFPAEWDASQAGK